MPVSKRLKTILALLVLVAAVQGAMPTLGFSIGTLSHISMVLLAGGLAWWGLRIVNGELLTGFARLIREIGGVQERVASKARIIPWSNDEFADIIRTLGRLQTEIEENRETELYLKDILASMDEGLLVIDPQGTIYSSNHAISQMLGFQDGELLGTKFSQLILSKPETSSFNSLLESQPRGGRVELTLAKQSSVNDKPFLQTEVSWHPLKNNSRMDQKLLYIVIVADMSEKKELEAQLFHAQKMESLGQLAGGIAHDFNNLLGGISGSAEVLRKHVSNNQAADRRVDVILKCVERAADLTKQLLGFARKGRYEIKPLLVDQLFDEATSLLEKTISKEVSFRVLVQEGTWGVLGDSSQLLGALINLSVNARDAMAGKGTITLEAQNVENSDGVSSDVPSGLGQGSWVKLSVGDTGCGIAPENMDKIFEPFFTTKEIGKGTGLGLAMVFGIIRNHGGLITVDSKLSAGTTFNLYLPANKDIRVQAESYSKEDRFIDFGKLKGKKILVVDDEPLVRDSTCSFLEQCGFKVSVANDGVAALELYKTNKGGFDAIILDVIMPDKDGIEVFGALREITPTVPIIFYSGYAESDRILVCRKEGKVGFIQKPYLPDKILGELLNVMK